MDVQYMGDPALIPIRGSEVAFFVRSLHIFATKINDMVRPVDSVRFLINFDLLFELQFPREIDGIWKRNGILGQLARQILYPPMTIRSFDKTQGISREIKQEIGARITFRQLGSYKTCATIFGAYLIGHLMYGSGISGISFLMVVTFIYIVVLSFLNDPRL